ncbi:MAG TPA: hypothetical protein VD835_18850 [Pyrinomonadaceae bacterium]|nr:hypothetical protein [Pyrinomonadaceae bacterium]
MSERKHVGGNALMNIEPPKKKIVGFGETPATPITPPTPVTPVSGVTPVKEDAAPKRDFTRVANSILREAVPAGAFTGKGKQLYDFLYSQTRGAIVPKMSARLRTERVIKAAGMSRPTYKAHLARLVALGLIGVEEKVGEHGGNVFTVYLPEELGNSSKWGNQSKPTNSGKELEGQLGQESYSGNPSLSVTPSTISDTSKTLIKTKDHIDDDAALAELLKHLERELIGKNTATVQQWGELTELLLTELKIAAARTVSVSNVPAFLTEHLRRRLFKRSKDEMQGEGSETANSAPVVVKVDATGCPDCGGSSWWYPNGQEKGVARCTHKRLPSVPRAGE